MFTVSLDLGGSHIGCAIVEHTRIFSEIHVCTDAKSLARDLSLLAAAVRQTIEESKIDAALLQGIGVGFCGVVDGESGEILSILDKYADARSVDLHAWARREFNLPLRLENDACLALLGEHAAGAAQGTRDVVMITLGTGIGGAAMLGGKLLRSRAGQAGCLGGHLPINFRGRRCSCGAIGCAEAEASTAALPSLCREHRRFAESSLANEPILDFKTLFDAVDRCDEVAQDVLKHCMEVWCALTVGVIHAYGPELVVFGGGVMQRGDALLDPIRAYVARHAWRTVRGLPRIEKAQLGERAALIGGAALFSDIDVMQTAVDRGRGTHV